MGTIPISRGKAALVGERETLFLRIAVLVFRRNASAGVYARYSNSIQLKSITMIALCKMLVGQLMLKQILSHR